MRHQSLAPTLHPPISHAPSAWGAKVLAMKKFALTLSLAISSLSFAQTTPAQTAPSAPATTKAPAAAPATDPNAVVAQIGSEKITLGEFNRDFQVAAARVVNQQGMPFEAAILTEFASARPEYLKQYVRDRAVYQLARIANKPDAAALDAQFAEIKGQFKTDEELTAALAQTGFANLDDFKQNMERQSVVAAYLQSIQKRFTFKDTLVNAFYNLHKSSFTSDAEACVKHILVPTKPEAEAIVKDLGASGDFAKIAQEKSKDPGSAAKGGDLGCIAPGDTVAAFDKASFSGPLNQAQVVQTEYGWHILIVTKRTEAGLKPLADVAPQIREQLSRDAAQKYLDAQIAKLKVQSFPEVVTVPESPAKK